MVVVVRLLFGFLIITFGDGIEGVPSLNIFQ